MRRVKICSKVIEDTYLHYSDRPEFACGEVEGEPEMVYCMIVDVDFNFGEEPFLGFEYVLDLEFTGGEMYQYRGEGKVNLPESSFHSEQLNVPAVRKAECGFIPQTAKEGQISGEFHSSFEVRIGWIKVVSIPAVKPGRSNFSSRS